ncbi:type II toxin-antitoxin system RelE/ParE family toxin [Vacuolonema iberomarrocanum]|uniref:type II toxin-antitoxin system RelE/ParE family toxin n=1 Tax=Vacuolonema iberomarrocanum TaxID=3454632 RepID=UPI001A10444B|nr:type II toxin-antitoxin system RelE/ParE family toxin [filamentous cyanobacterium LEGE 07170]
MTDKRIPAKFYKTEAGNEPVREWLKQLAPAERKVIGIDIKTIEYGWPIGMPTCRSMGKGLYEVRSNLPNGTIARVLFCIYQENILLLHGFIKKTQKTPKQDLDLALKRKKKLEAEK